MTPQQFAESFIPVASANHWWMGVSEPSLIKPNLMDPDSGHNETVGRDPKKPGRFSMAVSSALSAIRAANPFNGVSPLADGVGRATSQVGEQASNMIKAGVETVHEAGEGVKSGFRWATLIIFFGLALYLFLLVAPFLPKPRTA